MQMRSQGVCHPALFANRGAPKNAGAQTRLEQKALASRIADERWIANPSLDAIHLEQ
jgi:hypothetical protein